MVESVLLWKIATVVSTAVAIWALFRIVKYEKSSHTDHLTGLFNRRWLEYYLKRLIKRSGFGGNPISVIFVDLDHFKEINDTKGHIVGDRVLARVANVLLHSVRPTDAVFRYGGDEFVIILPNTGLNDSVGVAKKLLCQLRDCSAGEYGFSKGFQVASIGVASTDEGFLEAETLIGVSDERAYLSKQAGGNRISSGGA